MKDDRLYLIHIGECIARIESYSTGGKDAFPRFDADSRCSAAQPSNIGRIDTALVGRRKVKHPEVDWYKIAGFRNILVYDYLGVDLNSAWLIVERELPRLKQTIEAMQKELS